MTKISAVDRKDLITLEREIQRETKGIATLEQAAQRYTEVMYDHLKDSFILLRLFATIPMARLPDPNQKFVKNLAASANIADMIKDETLVLSLIGTSGKDPSWNDRKNSQGHVGIPLASPDFIDEIPMMSRLLKQLGVDLDWIERGDTAIVGKTLGSASGCFFVREATEEVDVRGRKIIAAQDFVNEWGVKTVFGIGGGYMGSYVYVVTIGFCNEVLDQPQAEQFMPQINRLKVNTVDLVKQEKLFVDG